MTDLSGRYPDPGDRFFARLAQIEDRLSVLERVISERDLRTYTPVLTALGGGLNRGSTAPTPLGDYTITNGRCHWRAIVTFLGSGISGGTGDFRLTLPVAASVSIGAGGVGSGWYYASGVFHLVSLDGIGGTTTRLVADGGLVSGTFPAAPISGSVLSVSGDYPIS